MENSKCGSIPMQEKQRLSKSQGASTPAELKRMNTKDMFLIYGGAVDWKSTKQSIFITSSAEAEYITAYDASKEAVWVRKFIFGLGVVPTIKELINMYYDNTRAITIANESGITKDDNLADPFTKALAFPKHSEHTRNIGMLPGSTTLVFKKEFVPPLDMCRMIPLAHLQN
ncbi:hypothetical protein Tco_1268430 [Tanacetum coccineum]